MCLGPGANTSRAILKRGNCLYPFKEEYPGHVLRVRPDMGAALILTPDRTEPKVEFVRDEHSFNTAFNFAEVDATDTVLDMYRRFSSAHPDMADRINVEFGDAPTYVQGMPDPGQLTISAMQAAFSAVLNIDKQGNIVPTITVPIGIANPLGQSMKRYVVLQDEHGNWGVLDTAPANLKEIEKPFADWGKEDRHKKEATDWCARLNEGGIKRGTLAWSEWHAPVVVAKTARFIAGRDSAGEVGIIDTLVHIGTPGRGEGFAAFGNLENAAHEAECLNNGSKKKGAFCWSIYRQPVSLRYVVAQDKDNHWGVLDTAPETADDREHTFAPWGGRKRKATEWADDLNNGAKGIHRSDLSWVAYKFAQSATATALAGPTPPPTSSDPDLAACRDKYMGEQVKFQHEGKYFIGSVQWVGRGKRSPFSLGLGIKCSKVKAKGYVFMPPSSVTTIP